ncbi:hypothetical protein IZ6_25130 [Terrihabitans soli]|uniref:Phage tail tape measure protein domain-containing protein n=1 Tax=Terrihabitans soli TaxID=708113 RepID=A0A6S6QYV1_9HYPH|nr:phage tail tape measure protein [Terrihabitans soli]BCJ91778.1 hypothetical protein IZ6_25130 [Terrihabitans soli]
MAGENGSIGLNVFAQAEQARKEFDQLKASIDGVIKSVAGAQKQLNQLSKINIDGQVIASKYTKGDRSLLDSLSRGSKETQRTEALVKRKILELNTSMEQVTARLVEAHTRAAERVMKTSKAQVEAGANLTQQRLASRLRNSSPGVIRAKDANESFRLSQLIKDSSAEQLDIRRATADLQRQIKTLRSDPESLRARLTGAAQSEANSRARLRYGDDTVRNAGTLGRITNNGGSDFLQIQGAILRNYLVLGAGIGAANYLKNQIVEIDRELKQFQAITQTTNSEMEGFEQQLFAVASGSKFSALEVAKAATVLGQAGLSTAQVKKSIESVVLLATASGTDLQTSVDVVTSTLGVFNLEASETANIANVMTSALNLSKLTMEKLSLGIQYSANIAADAGVTYTELTAVLAGLSNAGIKSGSTLGTGLRQLMIDIMNPSKEFLKILTRIGLTTADVDIKTKGFTGVMHTLRDAGFTTADAVEAFEVRAVSAFSAISKNLTYIHQLHDGIVVTEAAAKANATQMEALGNIWDNFASTVASSAYTAFRPTISILKEILKGATALARGMQDATWFTIPLSAALAGLGTWAVVSPLVFLVKNFGQLRTVLLSTTVAARVLMATMAGGSAVGAVGGLGGLLSFVKGHPALMIAGLAAAAVTAFAVWETAAQSTAKAIDEVSGKVNELGGAASETESRISSISERMKVLYDRYDELDNDDAARRSMVLELKAAYSEWGLSLSTTTDGVEELIGALTRLEEAQRKALPDQLMLQQQELQNKLALERQQLGDRSSNIGDLNRFQSIKARRLASSEPAFGQAVSILSGKEKAGEGFNVLSGLLVKLNEAIERNKADEYATEQLKLAYGLIKTQNANINNLESTKYAIDGNTYRLGQAIALKEGAERGLLGRNVSRLYPTSQLSGIKDPTEREEAAKNLEGYLQLYKSGIEAQITKLATELAQQGAGDLEDIKTYLLAEFHKNVSPLDSEIGKVIASSGEAREKKDKKDYKFQTAGFQTEMAGYNTQINALVTQSRSPNIPGARIQEIADEVNSIVENMVIAATKDFNSDPERTKRRLDGDLSIDEELKEEVRRIREEGQRKIFQILERQYEAVEKEFDRPAEDVKFRLEAARNSNALPSTIRGLDAELLQAEKKANEDKLGYFQKQLAELNKEKATGERLVEIAGQRLVLEEKIAEAQRKKAEYATSGGPTVGQAMNDGFQLWQVQQGLMHANGQMVSAAEQVGVAWNSVLNNLTTSFSGFFVSIANGTKTIKESFRDMALSVIDNLMQIIATALANQIIMSVLGLDGVPGSGGGSGGWLSQLFGTTKGSALGEHINTGIPGRDSTLRKVMPGEFILRKSAVDAIGVDSLTGLNNQGNRRMSESMAANDNKAGMGTLNVWVVSPDQVPPPGPNDIVATVADNLQRKGVLKQLVKQIAIGG